MILIHMSKFSIEKYKDIPLSKENMKKKNIFFLYKNSDCSTSPYSNSLDSFEPNKCLNNSPSIELNKNDENYANNKDIFDIKDSNEGNNSINFLGKKTKVSFCITKKSKHNPIFYISKIMKDKDHLFFHKDHNREIRKISQKKKLFQTYKFFYQDDSIKNTNRGKWSYEEHIRFIESFVNYGKKWKIIQKYIGTRSCNQIISHAQKFFLRLKELKSDKYCFNFKNNNIQSLSDVINIIARSNKTGKNDKKYIIDTLIDLTELNIRTRRKKYSKRKKYNFMVKIQKMQKEMALNDKASKIDDELLNKINANNKHLEFDDFISDNDLINDEAEDEVIISDKNSYLEDKYINNDNLLESRDKEKNTINNNEEINFGQNYNCNYKNKENPKNQNFIDINNTLLLSDSSKSFKMDSLSVEPVGDVFKKNIESTFFKFMN